MIKNKNPQIYWAALFPQIKSYNNYLGSEYSSNYLLNFV